MEERYYWDKETIEKRILEYREHLNDASEWHLKKCYKEVINDLEEVLTWFDNEEIPFNLKSEILTRADFAKYNPDVGAIISGFRKHDTFLRSVGPKCLSPIEVKDEELVNFMDAYYAKLDPRIRDAYDRIRSKINTNHYFYNNMDKKLNDGVMYPVRYLNEIYTACGIEGLSSDYLNLIHEFGHGIEFMMTGSDFLNHNWLFREVVPIFFELVACDEIGEILPGEDKKLHDYLARFYQDKINKSKLGWDSAMVAKHFLDSHQKTIYHRVSKLVHVGSVDVGRALTNEFYWSDLTYAVSYTLAIELYIAYKTRKRNGLNLLDKFMVLEQKDINDILKFSDDKHIYPGTSTDAYLLKLSK